MKRSEINKALKDLENMLREYQYFLPKFADFTPEEWKSKGHEFDEILDNMLGWDITDYGLGRFDEVGFSLITLRNGNPKKKDQYPKPYAEKLLYIKEGQMAPMHFHWYKMEDIINRGGGNLAITLYNCTEEDFKDVEGGRAGKSGTFADTLVTVSVDGCNVTVPAGGQIILKPGQSVTLKPGQYHTWQGVPGTGKVMLFEVSTCNDDTIDNRFHTAGGRIPEIEEDDEAKYLIFADYKDYVNF